MKELDEFKIKCGRATSGVIKLKSVKNWKQITKLTESLTKKSLDATSRQSKSYRNLDTN